MNEAENVTVVDQVRIHHCNRSSKVWVICILEESTFFKRSKFFFLNGQIFWWDL